MIFLISSAFAFSKGNESRLNVLLITIDTLRADRLGCYGNRNLLTPAIDSLAERGFLFEKAFAHTPTTLPSHTNILLGTTPLRHGVHDNSNFIVRPGSLTLANHLKSAGYSTAAFIGAFPLDSRFGLTQGFDVYDDNYGNLGAQEFSYVERRAEAVVHSALKWLEQRDGPWFLWIHCFDPHQKYDPPEPFRTRYKDRLYDGEVAYVDSALAKLFDVLREKKYMDNTVIVFTGDHGESLGQHGESTHGYFAYNATLHVPLFILAPGLKPGRSDQSVCHVDIFPTVCDILGLSWPSSLDGVSLVPVVKGRKLQDRAIYFESLYPYYSRGWGPLRGIISKGRKFIDSPIPEFYDLEADFGEAKNLAQSTDLRQYNESLGRLMASGLSGPGAGDKTKMDRQSREKLASLGYLASFRGPFKKTFTREDDLKVLLPYQNKLTNAMGAYHQGAIETATALLKEILAERKDFDLAYTYLATIYKEQKKWKDALDILRRGYQLNPSSYRIVTSFGIFLADMGAPDEAIEILKKGLAIIDYDPEAWNYLGVAYWKKGALDEAGQAYEKALSIDNNYPIVLNNLGSLFLSRFQKDKSQDFYLKAVGFFQKAVELAPDYPSPYNGLGTAFAQAGDMEKAIVQWKKAVELKPDFGFALYNLGVSYLASGDKVRALKYLTKYKDQFYGDIPTQEKQKLDAQIERCLK
jgi:arylsulfatase A-like enzyme/Tfp pilus assembly protein PilF